MTTVNCWACGTTAARKYMSHLIIQEHPGALPHLQVMLCQECQSQVHRVLRDIQDRRSRRADGLEAICQNCGMAHAPDDKGGCIEGHGDDEPQAFHRG